MSSDQDNTILSDVLKIALSVMLSTEDSTINAIYWRYEDSTIISDVIYWR